MFKIGNLFQLRNLFQKRPGRKDRYEEHQGLSKRVTDIIDTYGPCLNALEATHSFVKAVLNPQPDRYDMLYRYEHTLRTSVWGKRIAEAEGWESEPLIMACLLHDVGYPECRTIEEFNRHPAFSAEITDLFLKKIDYDRELSKKICKAIAIHDKWNDFPADATPFELSVRDADDLDRFDVMRMCMRGRTDIGEHNATEIIDICNKRLSAVADWCKRICGTSSAERFWKEKMQTYQQFYEELRKQMESTFEMES